MRLADVLLDVMENIADRDEIVGPELRYGVDEIPEGVGTNRLRERAASSIILRLVPSSRHHH